MEQNSSQETQVYIMGENDEESRVEIDDLECIFISHQGGGNHDCV